MTASVAASVVAACVVGASVGASVVGIVGAFVGASVGASVVGIVGAFVGASVAASVVFSSVGSVSSGVVVSVAAFVVSFAAPSVDASVVVFPNAASSVVSVSSGVVPPVKDFVDASVASSSEASVESSSFAASLEDGTSNVVISNDGASADGASTVEISNDGSSSRVSSSVAISRVSFSAESSAEASTIVVASGAVSEAVSEVASEVMTTMCPRSGSQRNTNSRMAAAAREVLSTIGRSEMIRFFFAVSTPFSWWAEIMSDGSSGVSSAFPAAPSTTAEPTRTPAIFSRFNSSFVYSASSTNSSMISPIWSIKRVCPSSCFFITQPPLSPEHPSTSRARARAWSSHYSPTHQTPWRSPSPNCNTNSAAQTCDAYP